jgi:hypothetical protein
VNYKLIYKCMTFFTKKQICDKYVHYLWHSCRSWCMWSKSHLWSRVMEFLFDHIQFDTHVNKWIQILMVYSNCKNSSWLEEYVWKCFSLSIVKNPFLTFSEWNPSLNIQHNTIFTVNLRDFYTTLVIPFHLIELSKCQLRSSAPSK